MVFDLRDYPCVRRVEDLFCPVHRTPLELEPCGDGPKLPYCAECGDWVGPDEVWTEEDMFHADAAGHTAR